MARSGSHALEIAQGHPGPIHFAISNVVMPDPSEPEFVEKLRKARPDVRVLFVSGYTDDEVMKRGVLAGESAFSAEAVRAGATAQHDPRRVAGVRGK